MNKPLELTVYPKPRYALTTWQYQADPSKRLYDAELAAEVHYAVFHESECELRARKLGEGHPHFEHYRAANYEWARRAPILERFATLPHYDEDQA